MNSIVLIVSTTAFILVQALSSGIANAQWRTPPVKTVGNETVSCDLVNSSGGSITMSNIEIIVQTLEGSARSQVVKVPGPLTIADGRGLRGSSPIGVLAHRTVYCELARGSGISTAEANLFFTMTVRDAAGKAVTTATPRPTIR